MKGCCDGLAGCQSQGPASRSHGDRVHAILMPARHQPHQPCTRKLSLAVSKLYTFLVLLSTACCSLSQAALHTQHQEGGSFHPSAILSSKSSVTDRQLLLHSDSGASRRLLGSQRVVVVNDIPGHFEVLAGVLSTLQALHVKPEVVYVGAPNIPVAWGLLDWLGQQPTAEWDKLPRTWPLTPLMLAQAQAQGGTEAFISKLDTQIAKWHSLHMAESVGQLGLQGDVVLCVSAELAPDVCREVVAAVQPKLLLVMVHRADALSLHAKILLLHDRQVFFGLAPHVAVMAEQRMRTPVSWALPIHAFMPARGQCMQLACLQGFTIQGALRKYRNKHSSGYTRNYHQLWQRLAELKQGPHSRLRHSAQAGSAEGAVLVTVLGKGTRISLGIPTDLEPDIQFFSRLPYPEFWGRIHHSLALVPSLGHDEYFLSRITSTVIASLITSTPIIAEQRMLDAYQFLQPQHVFLRLPGEDEAAAMYRISALPEAEVVSRRAALIQLRESLNKEAVGKLAQWLQQATS